MSQTHVHVPSGTRLVKVPRDENPSPAQREVTIMGRVQEHCEITTGHWFWKDVVYGIRVSLSDDGRERLNDALQSVGHPPHPNNSETVMVELAPIDLPRFSVGTLVEATLGLNSEAMHFFLARSPRFGISVRNLENGDLVLVPDKPL